MTIYLMPFIGLTWIQIIAIVAYFIATMVRTLNVTALQVPVPQRGDFPPGQQGDNTFDFATRLDRQLRPKRHRAANVSLLFALVSGLIGTWAIGTANPVTEIQTEFGIFKSDSFGIWLTVASCLLIHFAAFGAARYAFYRYS